LLPSGVRRVADARVVLKNSERDLSEPLADASPAALLEEGRKAQLQVSNWICWVRRPVEHLSKRLVNMYRNRRIVSLREIMFTTHWWRPARTVSDEGFSITLGFKELLYEVDGKRMTITIEGAGQYVDVFHSSMRCWTNDSSVIDGQTDERNVDNVTRALESRGLNVRIVT
jgi:hypothetical protein